MENSQLEYQEIPMTKPSKLWLWTALLSCLTMGVGVFLISFYNSSPFATKSFVSLGFATTGICLLIAFAQRFSKNVVTKSKLTPGVISAFVLGAANNFANISLFIGYYNDVNNASAISLMVVGSAVISAVIIYYVYDEKLSPIQITGMSICVLGLILTGLISMSDGNVYGYIAGLVALCFYAVRNISVRSCQVSGLDFITALIINTFAEAVTAAVMMVCLIPWWSQIFTDLEYWYFPYLGGILISFGSIMLTHSAAFGKVGPAVVIANMLGIVQMILDYIFLSKNMDLLKIIGSLICFLGVVVMIIGEEITNYFKTKF